MRLGHCQGHAERPCNEQNYPLGLCLSQQESTKDLFVLLPSLSVAEIQLPWAVRFQDPSAPAASTVQAEAPTRTRICSL